jgi:hypothetical protein
MGERKGLEAFEGCALPAALEAMGERWSFLILRAAFNGIVYFEDFQSTLGIARNILSNRLGRLVTNGISISRCSAWSALYYGINFYLMVEDQRDQLLRLESQASRRSSRCCATSSTRISCSTRSIRSRRWCC